MRQVPKISIIVPAYNSEKTISRCIESLINQSLKELEIILVDDNSTDSTYTIMKKYQQQYPSRIVLLSVNKPKDTYGPGEARNEGLKEAKGTYIGFVDSDDWGDSSLFRTAYENAMKEDADIAIFGVKDELSNNLCSEIRYQYEQNTINHIYALNMLCRLNNNDRYISPMVCQKIYRKDFLKRNHIFFEPNSYYEDDQFSFYCFLHDCKIVLVPEVYYHYYQNTGSITHTFSKEHIDTLIMAFINMRNYLQNNLLYDTYSDYYFSYMDKCLASTLNILFSSEPAIQIQKKYLIYLFKQLSEHFSIEESITYLDTKRIQRFFHITE